MVTLRVQIHCDECNGQGLIRRGRWIEDKYTYQQQHVTEESDCERCSGQGHYMQTVTLDQTAITEIARAIGQTISVAAMAKPHKGATR